MPAHLELWSLSRPALPSRSCLYAIDPVGIGTPFVESLTSYVIRLAEAHSVSVGDLVGRVLSDLIDSSNPIITANARAIRAGGHGFRACSHVPNGATEFAAKWIRALEAATGRSDVQYLTLFPFRHMLPGRLFRKRRAWCAFCLELWRSCGTTVYEPLLWAFPVASHCPLHARPLDTVCSHCGQTLSPLAVFSRPGYCHRCDWWLGRSDDGSDVMQPLLCSEKDAVWMSTQVGNLLSLIPVVCPAEVCNSFRRNLSSCVQQLTNGNVAALAEYIRCPPSILRNWLDGTSVPTIMTLARISRFLDIPTASLFNLGGLTRADMELAKRAIALIGSRDVAPFRNKEEIDKALHEAFKEPVPRSLSDVARTMGYTGTERLYQANRTLCHKIAARYRRSGRSHWWRKPGATRICDLSRMKNILEDSLRSHEPTSVHQIAANLGYANDAYIWHKFPELCNAISTRLPLIKQARSETLRLTLENALQECPPPTLADLARRLGYSTSEVLRAHEPYLCNRLTERYQVHVTTRRSDLERQAIAALSESPIPSVREVCQRLGITLWFMNEYFPSVRRQIALKHRRATREQTTQRRDKLFHDVYVIAAKLHNRGIYPSFNRICDQLPEGSYAEWNALHSAARSARRRLGIKA